MAYLWRAVDAEGAVLEALSGETGEGRQQFYGSERQRRVGNVGKL